MSWLSKYYQYKALIQNSLDTGVTTDELDALGYTKWDSVNNDLLSDGVIVSGLLSVTNFTDLPAASGVSGKVYLVTSPTPAIYLAASSAWYQIGGKPLYTWANKPAANSMAAGGRILIDPSSFTGTYKATAAVEAVTDGTKWGPANGRQLLCSAASSVASPLATGSATSATAYSITEHFSVPANFFTAGQSLDLRIQGIKTGAGTAASIFALRFGKLATAGNDSAISVQTNAAANREVDVTGNAVVTTLGAGNTAVFRSGTLLPNSGANAGPLYTDKSSTPFDTTVALYVVPCGHSLVTADTTALLGYSVYWVG